MRILPIATFLVPVAGPASARRARRSGRSPALSMGMRPGFEWFEPRVLLSGPPVMADIDALGFGSDSGQIQSTASGQPDVDVYEYVAPATQVLDVQVDAQGTLQSAALAVDSPAGQPLLIAPGVLGQRITEVRFGVVAGTTYDFEVSAGAYSFSGGQSGPYRLIFSDFSNQFDDAYPLMVPSGAMAVQQAGAIDPSGYGDWFEVTSPITGFMTADLAAVPDGSLEGQLLVEDATGSEHATDANAGRSLDSRVTGFAVTQGTTYFILASASRFAPPGAQTGQYELTLSFSAPVVGHSPATATPLALSPTGGAFQAGLITVPGVSDFYGYVATQTTNLVVREEVPTGSGLDSHLTVTDSAGNPLPGGISDNASWVDGQGAPHSGSEVRVAVVAGQTYDIEAGAFGSSTGAYQLSIIPDGANDTFATAMPLTLPADGTMEQGGAIVFPGDVQFYQFVAPTSGEVTAQQDAVGGILDSLLTVYDAGQHLLAFDDDSNPNSTHNAKNSLLQFPVVAGQAYFVEAAAFPNIDGSDETGGYSLILTTNPNPPPDNQPDTFAKAQPVDVGSGFAGLSGQIGSGDVVNIYRFVALSDESIEVDLNPSDGSNFQGDLYAFDAAGNQVANDYNLALLQDDTSNSVQFNARAGQTYYIQVGVNRGRVGTYDLRFEAAPTIAVQSDGLGQTFATATVLALGPQDDATVGGTIEQTGDVNVFKFQAVATTTLTIRLFAAPGSRLDTFLVAFSDSQSLLNENDDTDVTVTRSGSLDLDIDRNSVLELSVVAGKTYYLRAASAGSSTGAYFLALSSARNDVGDRIGDVSPPLDPNNPVEPVPVQAIPLGASGAASQSGVIVMPGDLDAFQFTATLTGLMTVQQQAAPGSPLDSYLYAFDSSRAPLANNNDHDGTYNSLVQFNVEAGQTYYLKAAAYGISVGAYVLTLSTQPPDPSAPGASFATAAPLVVSATGPTVRQGTIVAAGDVQVYLFTAPVSGTITVQEQAAPGSPLDSYLYAYNGSQGVNNFDGLQALIAGDDDSQGTLNSLIQFNVTAGQPYYLEAAGFGTSIGAYVLTLNYGGAAIGPPVGHTFEDAGTIALGPSGYGSQTGVITSPGGVDMYRFVAPYTGMLPIRQVAPSAGTLADKNSPSKSILDSVLTIFDAARTMIAENDDDVDDDTLNSYVDVPIVAGQTYYVQAAGYGSTTGSYELLFDDDVTNGFADASLTTIDTKLLSATVFGTIEVPDDVDMYRFVAPVTGPITVTQQATGGGLLDSYLFLYDGSQTLIASDNDETIDPTGPGGGITIPDSLVQANVVAGQTYYIRAASSNGSATDPGRTPTGAYRLQVTFPAFDFGETFADARTIPPPGPAVSTQAGHLLAIGEVDMFQFAAAESGAVTFDVEPTPGTTPVLDPIVVAYDAQGNEIARGTNELAIGVQAGSLHYIQVGGYGASTGGFVLSYSERAGDGLGLDFGSAIPISLSGAGAGQGVGVLGPAGDVNVFQFAAPATGTMIVTLAAGSPDDLAAFTISNGKPTQIAADTTRPGVLTFAVAQGQTYFVRVTSTGSGGGYRLALGTSIATAAAPDLQLPGKSTYVAFGQSYTATIAAAGPSATAQQDAAGSITAALVAEFIASQHGHVAATYLLVWTDPVDFVLTDSQARETGYTAGRGPISEVGGGYNSGAGALKLAIVPYTGGAYDLNLIGVDEGPVLFGAALITATGESAAPSGDPQALPVTLQSMSDLVVVLDFNLAETTTPLGVAAPPPAVPDSPAVPANPAGPTPLPASPSTGLALATNPFIDEVVAVVAGLVGRLDASDAAAGDLRGEPSSVTTLLATQSNNGPTTFDLSHGEVAALVLPMLVDLAPGAVGMNPAGGGDGGGAQGLAAWMQTLVQPLVGGFNALGGHLKAIFTSIFPTPTRPGVDPPGLGVREDDGSRAVPEEVGRPTIAAETEAGRLETRGVAMKGEVEGRPPIPVREPAGVVETEGGTSARSLLVVALMAQALRPIGARPRFPIRIATRQRRRPE